MSRKTISDPEGDGAGPFEFRSPALASDETWVLDLPNKARNGKKRFYRKHLPFDTAQITNLDVDNAVEVTYNERYNDTVVPNTNETFTRQGIVKVRVTNIGSTAIDAEDVRVSVTREPYGADDAARDRRQSGIVGQVVENFTGVNPINAIRD